MLRWRSVNDDQIPGNKSSSQKLPQSSLQAQLVGYSQFYVYSVSLVNKSFGCLSFYYHLIYNFWVRHFSSVNMLCDFLAVSLVAAR